MMIGISFSRCFYPYWLYCSYKNGLFIVDEYLSVTTAVGRLFVTTFDISKVVLYL